MNLVSFSSLLDYMFWDHNSLTTDKFLISCKAFFIWACTPAMFWTWSTCSSLTKELHCPWASKCAQIPLTSAVSWNLCLSMTCGKRAWLLITSIWIIAYPVSCCLCLCELSLLNTVIVLHPHTVTHSKIFIFFQMVIQKSPTEMMRKVCILKLQYFDSLCATDYLFYFFIELLSSCALYKI